MGPVGLRRKQLAAADVMTAAGSDIGYRVWPGRKQDGNYDV